MRAPMWVVAASLAIGIGACKGIKENYDKEFKASYVREFATGCAKGAMQKGMPEAKAKSACECMARFLVDHHTTTELTKLSLTATSAESQKVMEEAGAACRGGLK
jgi:hypothetical protein